MINADAMFAPDPNKPIVGKAPDPYKWLLIDGGGMAVTAWATHRDLDTPEDRVKASIYIFVTVLASLAQLIEKNAKIIVVWDGYDNRAFRRGRHPWYKYGRGSVIDRNEVRVVIKEIGDLLEAMGIGTIKLDGCEADDVVATLSRIIDQDLEETVLIFSDDNDYRQLINHRVHLARRSMEGMILSPHQCELMGIDYGIEYLFIKALMGDPGDNIRGLKGIGEKKAKAIVDCIPDLIDLARLEDYANIAWDQLDRTTRNAVIRSGRRLLSPAPFATKDKKAVNAWISEHGLGHNISVDVDFDDDDCLEFAAKEAAWCFDLVLMDLEMPCTIPTCPDPNVDRIPSILRKLELDEEEDLLSSILVLSGMGSTKLQSYVSARRAEAIDRKNNEAAPPGDMF